MKVARIGLHGYAYANYAAFSMSNLRLTKNFTLCELTVTSKPIRNDPNDSEIKSLTALAEKVLQPLRDAIGKPVHINSAFRSESVNRLVGGSPTSQHRLGQAADIRVDGMTPRQVVRKIIELKLPFDQLIEEPTWTHVSFGPRKRRQVLRAFWEGGRMHYKAFT